MKYPLLILFAFFLVLFFSGCSDEDYARTERVLNGAYNGYRGGYYPPPTPVVPVAPVYSTY